MIVYVDLIFLVNFAADLAILLATAWTRKLRVKLWRMIVASVIGALYGVMLFFPEWSVLFSFLMKVLFSACMMWIAFGFVRLQAFLRNLGAFYLSSFALAGGIFGLHYLFMPPKEMMDGIWYTHSGGLVYTFKIGTFFLVSVFILMFWFYLRVFQGTKKRQVLAEHMAQVEVKVQDFTIHCTGLVDTGNQLYDPLTKTPVMITEAELWKDAIPPNWMKQIRSSDVDTILAAMGKDDDFIWQDRLRVVPYRGVNRSTQFMLAIKPDEVTVIVGERTLSTGKVLIGFDGGTLSSDGTYQAIIHPMLLQV